MRLGLKRAMLPLVVMAFFAATLLSIADLTPVSAANCRSNFFGLPAWYDGLTDAQCNITQPEKGALGNWIWRIVLNIIEALIIVVGYACVIMIIVGGYMYMVATGDAGKIKSAKGTIRNAIVGLVIALASVAIVNAIAGALR